MNIDPNKPSINSSKKDTVHNPRPASNTSYDKSSKAGAHNHSDNVSLSGKAKALGELEKAVKSSSDVNTALVEKVKTAIAEGRYTIDTHQIAKNMVDRDDFFGPS